jgi:hypothetical protein
MISIIISTQMHTSAEVSNQLHCVDKYAKVTSPCYDLLCKKNGMPLSEVSKILIAIVINGQQSKQTSAPEQQ